MPPDAEPALACEWCLRPMGDRARYEVVLLDLLGDLVIGFDLCSLDCVKKAEYKTMSERSALRDEPTPTWVEDPWDIDPELRPGRDNAELADG